MIKHLLFLSTFLLITNLLSAQDEGVTFETFKDTRVINTHSVETLHSGKLDIRIGHRFGNLAQMS